MSSGSRSALRAPSSVAKQAPCARRCSITSAVAPVIGSSGSVPSRARVEQPTEIGAEHHGDRRGLVRRARGRVDVARPGRQAQPADLALVAEPIERGVVVAAQPAADQLGFPRGRGGFPPLQPADDLGQPFDARELRAGCEVLPAQEEAHEVLGGRGLDAAAPALARVRVHAREQPARHPLPSSASRRVAALQREALVFERGERDRDLARPAVRSLAPSAAIVVMPASSR